MKLSRQPIRVPVRAPGRVFEASGGAPMCGAIIMLFPAEPHKLRLRSARLHGFTDADGGFTTTGAPGDYAAIIFKADTNTYSLTDEAVKELAATGQRVTLQPGERKSMDIIAPGSSKK